MTFFYAYASVVVCSQSKIMKVFSIRGYETNSSGKTMFPTLISLSSLRYSLIWILLSLCSIISQW